MLARTRHSLTWLVGLAALAVVAGPAAAQKKGKNKADQADAVEVKTVKPDAAPAKGLDPRAVADLIDRAVDQRLKAEKTPASPRCDDAEFLRRVYLDVT